MRHLDDGILRRIHDEPLILTTAQRAHLDGCDRCRSRMTTIAADVTYAEAALSGTTPAFLATPAWERLQSRVGETAPPPWRRRLSRRWGGYGGRARTTMGGAAAAVALVGALTLTPAGSLAQTFITIFQPKQVTPLFVTSSELRTLPDLRKYGTVHRPNAVGSSTAATASAASQSSGMSVLVPSSLPAGVSGSASYRVASGATGTFTFNAKKAKAAARKLHKSLPRMPTGVDGSTLRITTGAVVTATYGGRGQRIPTLLIGQTKAPEVSSTGVTVQQLEAYILSLPGVSPQLASAIRAINDPTSTLPIPIPVDKAHGETVNVQGVKGLAVGDATGLGSAVIWEKDGIIYGVGGTLPQSQVMSIAQSLH